MEAPQPKKIKPADESLIVYNSLKQMKRNKKVHQRLQRHIKVPLIHPEAHDHDGLRQVAPLQEDFCESMWKVIKKHGWDKDPDFKNLWLPTKDLVSEHHARAILGVHPQVLQAKHIQEQDRLEKQEIHKLDVGDATKRRLKKLQQLKQKIRNKEVYGQTTVPRVNKK